MARADSAIGRRYILWIALGLILSALLAACGGGSQPAEQAPATLAADAPTTTALPSATSAATQTPSPTIARPTATPMEAPTPTLEPTVTPNPSPTTAAVQLDVPALHTGSAPPTAASAQTSNVDDPLLPVRLVIPSLGIDYKPIPVGLDENRIPIVPKHDVGWYTYSARPGQGDNVVLWGHVLRWKDSPHIPAPFAALKDVQIGAQLIIYTADGAAHSYRISRVVWARPEEVQYILPTGSEQVTLVSCIGDKVILNGSLEMSHRQITIAVPEE